MSSSNPRVRQVGYVVCAIGGQRTSVSVVERREFVVKMFHGRAQQLQRSNARRFHVYIEYVVDGHVGLLRLGLNHMHKAQLTPLPLLTAPSQFTLTCTDRPCYSFRMPWCRGRAIVTLMLSFTILQLVEHCVPPSRLRTHKRRHAKNYIRLLFIL